MALDKAWTRNMRFYILCLIFKVEWIQISVLGGLFLQITKILSWWTKLIKLHQRGGKGLVFQWFVFVITACTDSNRAETQSMIHVSCVSLLLIQSLTQTQLHLFISSYSTSQSTQFICHTSSAKNQALFPQELRDFLMTFSVKMNTLTCHI